MGETAAIVQVTSESHSSASLSKEANGNCKNVNGSSLSSKCSNNSKMSSRVGDGRKIVENGGADFELCPKGHICPKCSSSLFGPSSAYYGGQDNVPENWRSFAKTRSTYNTEAVMDESGTDTFGNWWLGSYHY